ncbi:fimbrillin family protein, partial [Bacteroides sp. OttesenSCG-928-J23]|nr:fimbrillin family protein [Bacteroides sp. OttesenSCG-928-J23]
MAFKSGDEIGLYTDNGEGAPGSLKTNENPMRDVKNWLLTLGTNGKWQEDNAPVLKWKTDQDEDNDGFGDPADIYGYYPYQDGDFTTGGYPVFNGASTNNKLQDVLVAERTTVENNNPAIFLTFKHRFALLKVKLGTGLEGASSGSISVIMNKGIKDNAKIDIGTVDLQVEESGGITEFKPIKTYADYCYIIVPVEKISGTDSLEVAEVKIGDDVTPFSQSFIPRKNTIYNVTVHKGEKGSVAITMGGIEEWGSDRHLGNIREKGGLYWPSDVVGLTNALNDLGHEPTKADEAKFASWGAWDDDLDCFVFPVMRNIDMTEYTSEASRDCCIKEFYGVLDGKGHYINGLDIKGAGFIDTAKPGSVIKDLELKSVTVNNTKTPDDGTGALAGTVEGNVTIHNCSVTGTSAIKGGDNTGGLIGKGNPTMDRCSSTADVTGGSNTGGLIGGLESGGSIDQSYTVGNVTGTGNNVGGLAGSAAGSITDSHAGCDVTGGNNVGGLVGHTTDKISGSTATGHIKGADIVGGLAGSSTSTVSQSGANGTVTGTGITGGLIGKHIVSGDGVVITIEESYSQSAVSGGTTGGLIGNVTQPYVPKVPEVPETPELDEDGDPKVDADGNPIMIPGTPEVPAKGTEIINCYATNGTALIPGMTDGISYSYQVGSSSDEGDNVYLTIPLTATPEVVDAAIVTLNNGKNPGLWVKGLVMIDGIAYMLPVL